MPCLIKLPKLFEKNLSEFVDDWIHVRCNRFKQNIPAGGSWSIPISAITTVTCVSPANHRRPCISSIGRWGTRRGGKGWRCWAEVWKNINKALVKFCLFCRHQWITNLCVNPKKDNLQQALLSGKYLCLHKTKPTTRDMHKSDSLVSQKIHKFQYES